MQDIPTNEPASESGPDLRRLDPVHREHREDFFNAVDEILFDLIVWNAPDHEHTKIQARGWLEECLAEAFAQYEFLGGDAAQGLTS